MNYITWEKAVQDDKVESVAADNVKALEELMLWFGSNTAAQWVAMDLYIRAIELHKIYMEKSYSKYLFGLTEDLFAQVKQDLKDIEKATEVFKSISKVNSALLLKINQ